ncbi:MAG: hypothetical protein ACKOA0_15355, partial [Burkholderiaceae bacterium]
MKRDAISPVETQLRALMSRRILVLDGAMGTMIQRYKLSEEDYRGERFADFSVTEVNTTIITLSISSTLVTFSNTVTIINISKVCRTSTRTI